LSLQDDWSGIAEMLFNQAADGNVNDKNRHHLYAVRRK
jgi:hypothetical protein